MSDDNTPDEVRKLSQYKFLILIVGSISVAIILTIISMALYGWSGAIQSDLSRPGYQAKTKAEATSKTFEGFPGTGPIDAEVLKEFKEKYDKQAARATALDAFGNNVLDDSYLKIDDPALIEPAPVQ